MPRSSRDEEFSAFVQTRRTGLVRSACLLTAWDTHLAEDLVQTALAIGKLVVMLQSRDATSPPTEGTPQPVNGRPGMFDVQGDIQSLTFQIAGGQWVVAQALVSLGWNSTELAKFASGVQVLVTAQQGRG